MVNFSVANYNINNVPAYNTTAFKGTSSNRGYAPTPSFASQPDTVELSTNKKQELSNGAKWGIGTGVVVGLGILAYALTRGKAGSKQVQQLAEHVEFKEAKTMEEAQKYAKEKLGVWYHDINNLEIANFINEWLTKVHNKSKIVDKTSYPKFIASSNEKQITSPFCMTSSIKANKNFEGHILGVNIRTFEHFDEFLNSVICDGSVIAKNKNGKFVIVDDAYKTDFVNNVIGRMNNYGEKSTIKEKMQLICDIQGIQDGEIINGKLKEKVTSIYHNLNHELGHLKHQYSTKDYESMKKIEEFKANNQPVSELTKEFLNDATIQKTAGKVSVYAKESPLEFVAETFAGLQDGMKFDDDVMALYKKYGGPSVS